jgi:hypothetical protein
MQKLGQWPASRSISPESLDRGTLPEGMEEHMARISVRESHNLGAAEARRRIDDYAGELAGNTFPGVSITDLHADWKGSTLETSFKASKGFFSKTITGSMQVEEAAVTLEVEVPDLVFAFVPRPRIESVMREKLRERLA